ncbi:TonB-dependent receptor [Aquimarina brevivitae]|uniref:Outer membrane receptor protein involved in Fe transport n=1 Tax=Aquimarina brevivitae TaxID=323412 RepID=A0A4V2F7D3_9FLAO|nr:TonB-dependent receptor [Aquimarina brevivitae]RZS99419.1 outer membrane receptor protein involved in Fe transport [Aquimarina brevivitae]
MKKITLLLTVILMASVAQTFAQGTVTGIVLDGESNAPLPGANIKQIRTANGTATDFDGKFSLKVDQPTGTINISYVGFGSKNIPFNVTNGDQDLGTIVLNLDNSLEEVVIVGTGIIDLAEDRKTPIAVSTIKGDDIQLKTAGNVEFTESMSNTPSVYVANQAGGFGDSQIFLRGFDDTNTAYLLNGQPINGQEDGRMYWSNWAGMADVANAVQVQRGLGSSKLAISSVGGTVNIISKSTEQTEGGWARLMGGNDSFGKATVSYNTGLSDSGWAFSVLIDHWQAHRKYSEGTAGQGQNYLFSVGYNPNEQHSFNFLITGAPQWHDQNFSQDLEVYQRFGEKHNRNSGFLDGERYTERRNYYHKPVANLNWDFDINEGMELSTVLYASWGRGGGTGGLGRGRIRVDNDNDREIDFDAIVENNIANADSNGYAGFGNSYIRRSSVNNHNWYGLLSNINITSVENWTFNLGFDSRLYHGDHFRQVNDLLGLNGFTDNFRTDRPSDYVFTQEYEADPWAAIFDFADEANRTQFDYSEDINYLGGFGQAEYATDKFSVFVQGAVSTQSFQREGRFVGTGNGLGKSEKLNKTGYNVKGGFSYNLTEQHQVFVNAGFFSRQPFLDNIFRDIRNSNDLAEPEVDNEEITSFEGGYRFRGGNFALSIDVYRTEWANRFLSTFGPELPNGDFTTYRLTDVAQVHQGVEYDFEYRPDGGKWRLRGFGSIGNWEFDGRTPYTLANNQTATIIEEGNIDISGTKIGRAAQTSFGFGGFVKLLPNLTVDADYNIYTDLYGLVDPEDVVQARLDGETYQAERLPAYDLVNAGLTYKFNFGEQRFTLRGNVRNLFNSSYISQRDAFGYYLGIGRTWNASLRYNF